MTTTVRQLSKSRSRLFERPWWLCIAVLALQGCTVIDVHDGQVSVKRHFGLLYDMQVSPGNHTLYMRSRGIGLIKSVDGLSLGYVTQTWLELANDDCEIILINPTRESTQVVQATLQASGASLASLCIAP